MQKAKLKTLGLKTLHNFQQLLGHINWLNPYLKVTKGGRKPLYDLLRGDPDPCSPRILTPAARKSLALIDKINCY